MKVMAFGEILWDVFPDDACLGGAPLNFAAHLARHGHEVYMLSAVGADDYGDRALAMVRDWQVRTDYVARLDHKETGKCLVTLDEAGVPQYDLKRDVAYDHIPFVPELKADVLYFGTLALRDSHNREVLAQLLQTGDFSEVFVDVNIRAPFYDAGTVAFAAENATILKISDEELPTVASLLNIAQTEPAAFITACAAAYPSVRCLIITRGAEGALVYYRDDDTVYACDSVNAEVVSTVGAGDSFSAAFLHQYGAKKPIPRCAAYAAQIAAFVVSRTGAIPPYDPKDFTIA